MALRAWTRLAALGAAALVTAACAPSTDGSGDGSGGDGTTLTVWSWRTEDVKAYEKIFDVYEESHPDVTVEFKAFKNDEYDTVLQTGLAEKGGPDVAQLRAYGGLQPLVEAGRLVPLDGKVEGTDAFDEALLESARGRTDGKLYGVPFGTQTLQVFYNKKVFAEHDLEPPQTWDEMVSAAKTLDQAGVVPFATTGKDSWMLPIVHDTFGAARYGGQKFADQVLAGEADFTDEDYVESLTLVDRLAPYFPDDVNGVSYTDAQVLFTTGKAAMYPGGSFELGFFRSQAPDLEMGVFEVPPPPGSVLDEAVTPGWVDGSYGVSKRSTHEEEAVELVEWMATKEFGQLFADEVKQLSAVPGVTPEDPLLAEMSQNYAESPAPYLLLVHFRYGEPTGTDLLGAEMQKMLLGDAQPAQVAGKLQKGVSQWFEPQG
jgi:raffinose/stachyose/melibiose transport system substrate-binding protein